LVSTRYSESTEYLVETNDFLEESTEYLVETNDFLEESTPGTQ
jgi:hypothetical protein